VKRLPPQIMPPRSYSISSGERDVTVTLTSLHCQTSCHGRNGGGFGGASPSSAHAMPAAKMMANTGASVFIVVLSFHSQSCCFWHLPEHQQRISFCLEGVESLANASVKRFVPRQCRRRPQRHECDEEEGADQRHEKAVEPSAHQLIHRHRLPLSVSFWRDVSAHNKTYGHSPKRSAVLPSQQARA